MRNILFSSLVIVLFLTCLKASANAQGTTLRQNQTAAQSTEARERKEGEQRFQENCGRCHNPPESLRPREVKAVLQHMRVRAMLSAEDEKLIRKYLAP
jgi:cytochrome c5